VLRRYWRGLPWDGLGWRAGRDTALALMRRRAAADWRRGLPRILRLVVWLADRAVWPLAALPETIAFAHSRGLGYARAAQLFGDCVGSGAIPMEAQVWRSLHGDIHPLPGRSASLVQAGLGAPEGHHLLADKLATAEHLSGQGIVFPALHRLYTKGQAVDLPALTGSQAGLFVKPRHGHAGRGCFALTRQGDEWRLDGRIVAPSALAERISRLALRDDVLVQDRLTAAPGLMDLAMDGKVPVLRLVTACLPAGEPFLHSALLTVGVPGQDSRHFLDGAIYAPADPATGRLHPGLRLAEPKIRMDRLDWSGTMLTGRMLPDFASAVDMVLHAMKALPPLPLVHWDIVLTPAGPVVLEGNSAGNWIIASLPGIDGLAAYPLAPLLERWMAADGFPG